MNRRKRYGKILLSIYSQFRSMCTSDLVSISTFLLCLVDFRLLSSHEIDLCQYLFLLSVDPNFFPCFLFFGLFLISFSACLILLVRFLSISNFAFCMSDLSFCQYPILLSVRIQLGLQSRSNLPSVSSVSIQFCFLSVSNFVFRLYPILLSVYPILFSVCIQFCLLSQSDVAFCVLSHSNYAFRLIPILPFVFCLNPILPFVFCLNPNLPFAFCLNPILFSVCIQSCSLSVSNLAFCLSNYAFCLYPILPSVSIQFCLLFVYNFAFHLYPMLLSIIFKIVMKPDVYS